MLTNSLKSWWEELINHNYLLSASLESGTMLYTAGNSKHTYYPVQWSRVYRLIGKLKRTQVRTTIRGFQCWPGAKGTAYAGGCQEFMKGQNFEMILRNSGMELSGLETASSVFKGRSWGVRGKDVGKLLYAATWGSSWFLEVKVAQPCPTLCDLEFSRPEYWSG